MSQMITLSEAIKRLKDRYALRRSNDPVEIIRTFRHVLDRDFNGTVYSEYIVDVRMKGPRLVLSLTHPVIIQEIESFASQLINAINRELEENLLLDIDFKVVPPPKETKSTE